MFKPENEWMNIAFEDPLSIETNQEAMDGKVVSIDTVRAAIELTLIEYKINSAIVELGHDVASSGKGVSNAGKNTEAAREKSHEIDSLYHIDLKQLKTIFANQSGTNTTKANIAGLSLIFAKKTDIIEDAGFSLEYEQIKHTVKILFGHKYNVSKKTFVQFVLQLKKTKLFNSVKGDEGVAILRKQNVVKMAFEKCGLDYDEDDQGDTIAQTETSARVFKALCKILKDPFVILYQSGVDIRVFDVNVKQWIDSFENKWEKWRSKVLKRKQKAGI